MSLIHFKVYKPLLRSSTEAEIIVILVVKVMGLPGQWPNWPCKPIGWHLGLCQIYQSYENMDNTWDQCADWRASLSPSFCQYQTALFDGRDSSM